MEEAVGMLVSDLRNIDTIPKVSPRCVATTNAPIDVNIAWELLEVQFCALRTVTGLPADLSKAIGKQALNLNEARQLSGNGAMSSLTGWKPEISTLSDTVNNMWLTINDMRGAVSYITENCCKVGCDSVKVDFDIKLDDTRTEMTLFFASKCKIPTGFKDCNILGNVVTITDKAGNTHEAYVKVAEEALNVEGIMINLKDNSAIDPNSDYTISMEACMTDGSMTCQKCINKLVTYKDTCSYCEITVRAGHSGNIGGELVIVYEN